MGITRGQLKKLGFKKDEIALEYIFPNDKSRAFILFKNQDCLLLREHLPDFTLFKAVVMLDEVGYFEMQRVLQDLSIGLNYEFRNQIS